MLLPLFVNIFDTGAYVCYNGHMYGAIIDEDLRMFVMEPEELDYAIMMMIIKIQMRYDAGEQEW